VTKEAKSKGGTWVAVIFALAAVVGVVAVLAGTWSDLGDAEMSGAGWTALVLGVVVTLALGLGLMSLVFYSHRRGYDERGDPRR
jgi:hypothetical protein